MIEVDLDFFANASGFRQSLRVSEALIPLRRSAGIVFTLRIRQEAPRANVRIAHAEIELGVSAAMSRRENLKGSVFEADEDWMEDFPGFVDRILRLVEKRYVYFALEGVSLIVNPRNHSIQILRNPETASGSGLLNESSVLN